MHDSGEFIQAITRKASEERACQVKQTIEALVDVVDVEGGDFHFRRIAAHFPLKVWTRQ
jgi:hypothetical protein